MPSIAELVSGALPAPVMQGGYHTRLAPLEEMAFQEWLTRNNIPFDPSQTGDYDMRGFYKAMMSGDRNANTSINANDRMMHFPDTYKTPYHRSFSRESRYATNAAPSWNSMDQLVGNDGKIVFDERKEMRIRDLLEGSR